MSHLEQREIDQDFEDGTQEYHLLELHLKTFLSTICYALIFKELQENTHSQQSSLGKSTSEEHFSYFSNNHILKDWLIP